MPQDTRRFDGMEHLPKGDKRRKLISISKEGCNGKYQIKWNEMRCVFMVSG